MTREQIENRIRRIDERMLILDNIIWSMPTGIGYSKEYEEAKSEHDRLRSEKFDLIMSM